MNYMEFKNAFVGAFQNYLPAKYGDWCMEVQETPKINGCKEAVHLYPAKGNIGSPLLYLDELYKYYQDKRDLEMTCQKAAAIFVSGMDYISKSPIENLLSIPKSSIIFALIHREQNMKLLDRVPHRDTLDLALIYRIMLKTEEKGCHSAVITYDLAERMGLTEPELYDLAMINTPRLLPVNLQEISKVFRVVTNKNRTLGATVMMYPGVLADLAKDIDSDLYILPSSIHEVFVIPDLGQSVAEMNQIVEEANKCVVEECEVLSNHVYHYQRSCDKVIIPSIM